jgi:hypothetical protein
MKYVPRHVREKKLQSGCIYIPVRQCAAPIFFVFNHEIKHTGQLWRCIYKGRVIVLEKKKNHKPQVICIVVWYIYAVFSLPVTWYSDQNVIVR